MVMPTMNSQNHLSWPPVAATPDPSTPSDNAITNPERRPRRFIRAASGMAMIAEPVVNAGAAESRQPVGPEHVFAEQRHDRDDPRNRRLTGYDTKPNDVERAPLESLLLRLAQYGCHRLTLSDER